MPITKAFFVLAVALLCLEKAAAFELPMEADGQCDLDCQMQLLGLPSGGYQPVPGTNSWEAPPPIEAIPNSYNGLGYDGPGYNGAGYNGPGYNGPGHNGPGYNRRSNPKKKDKLKSIIKENKTIIIMVLGAVAVVFFSSDDAQKKIKEVFGMTLEDRRPICQYDGGCYQVNADHRKKFKHLKQDGPLPKPPA